MDLCELLVENGNADVLPAWPVTWGVPFPAGVSRDAGSLQLLGPDGVKVPVQAEVLTRHADGSVCRLLVTAEPALPADSKLSFILQQHDNPLSPAQAASVTPNALTGAAGTLSLTGQELSLQTPYGDFRVEIISSGRPGDGDGTTEPLVWRTDSFTPFAQGPVMAGAVIGGDLCYRDEALVHLSLTVRLFAATPVLFCDVLVKNLQHAVVTLDSCEVRVIRKSGTWQEADYELRQVFESITTLLPLAARAKKTLSIEVHDQRGVTEDPTRMLTYNETWLVARDECTQTVIGVRDFFELFPYGVRIDPDRMTVECWPSWSEQHWRLTQGCGKTHQLALAFLPRESALTPRAVGYAFGKPPLPRVPLAAVQQAGSQPELLDYDPNRYPRVESLLFDLAYNRNRGYGKMHYGDDFSALYTNQLRGEGEVVWNNLEGDYPYHMFCQFLRTGNPFYFKEFRTAIQHWADVDFRDANPDPLETGALVFHSADHNTSVTSPCHNWAEGFREWYFATGDPRPLEILRKMADWIVRRDATGFFNMSPQPYVRACGWALIQMTAMQDVLARADLEAIIRRLCAELLDYCRAHNGLTMVIPSGGNWTARDNAFHTATVIIGAERSWRLYREPAMRELAITAAEALMDERTCTPEGIAVYITGPEQAFPMQQAASFAMAGLAVAWRLTGDERYVRRGMRMLEYCLDRGMIVDHARVPGEFLQYGDNVILNVMLLMPNSQLLNYQLRGLLQFMRAAHETGMLKAVDYKY